VAAHDSRPPLATGNDCPRNFRPDTRPASSDHHGQDAASAPIVSSVVTMGRVGGTPPSKATLRRSKCSTGKCTAAPASACSASASSSARVTPEPRT